MFVFYIHFIKYCIKTTYELTTTNTNQRCSDLSLVSGSCSQVHSSNHHIKCRLSQGTYKCPVLIGLGDSLCKSHHISYIDFVQFCVAQLALLVSSLVLESPLRLLTTFLSSDKSFSVIFFIIKRIKS